MSARIVTPGSLWRVLGFFAPSDLDRCRKDPSYTARATTVRALSRPSIKPTYFPSSDYETTRVTEIFFREHDVLTVGQTVSAEDTTGFNRDIEFVQVLLPKFAYINRTLFNTGLGYLERIA